MIEEVVLVVAVAVLAGAALLAVAIFYWRRQRILEFALRERERTLVRLTDRFGSAEEVVAFARSPEAEALFSTLDSPAAIARRLLAMIAVAIVLLAIGGGMWANALRIPSDADLNLFLEAESARWWGTLALALGLGLLAAAAVCARLGRRWGVLGR